MPATPQHMASGTAALRAFAVVLQRDIRIAWRRLGDTANPLLFFILVCALFPLGIGPAPEVLAAIAPGVVWVIALIASILATETLFRSDFEDSSLDQFLLSPLPLFWLILSRLAAQWLLTGLPLALISPLLGLFMQLPAAAMPALVVSLLLGSGIMCAIGAIGTALTVGLNRGGLLLALLVLPLYIPVLIFGSAAVATAAAGGEAGGQLALLGGMLLLAIALAPLAVSAALRIASDH